MVWTVRVGGAAVKTPTMIQTSEKIASRMVPITRDAADSTVRIARKKLTVKASSRRPRMIAGMSSCHPSAPVPSALIACEMGE